MEHERGPGYECPTAVGTGAAHRLGLMKRGVEMCVEVILVLEYATTRGAIPMFLTVVTMKPGISAENLTQIVKNKYNGYVG